MVYLGGTDIGHLIMTNGDFVNVDEKVIFC